MNEFQRINKLIEIESDLRAFRGDLSQRNSIALCMEYNAILKSLKKPIKYVYERPIDVINVMIRTFNLKEDFAINKTRNRENYVLPRQIAAVIMRHVFPKLTLAKIGSYLNQDHATVLHSIKACKILYKLDKEFKEMFDRYQLELLGGIVINMEE